MIPCPSVCFYETPSREFAEQLVLELNQEGIWDTTGLRGKVYFGFVSDEGMTTGETASIRRCMAKVQANEEPSVENAMQAKLIGHRAYNVALELDPAWPGCDATDLAATPEVPGGTLNTTDLESATENDAPPREKRLLGVHLLPQILRNISSLAMGKSTKLPAWESESI